MLINTKTSYRHLSKGTQSVNLIRANILKVRRSANAIVTKPSVLLFNLIHNRHDSKVIVSIVAPGNDPWVACKISESVFPIPEELQVEILFRKGER